MMRATQLILVVAAGAMLLLAGCSKPGAETVPPDQAPKGAAAAPMNSAGTPGSGAPAPTAPSAGAKPTTN